MELRMKICKKCNQSLEESLFNRNKTKLDGFEIYCKECAKVKSKLAYEKGREKYVARNKERYLENKEQVLQSCKDYYERLKSSRPEVLLLRSAKQRAKTKNLPIDITLEDIIIPEYCPILKIKLECSKGNASKNSPSLDKIIPELGYVKGNIQVISNLANTMKWDANFKELVNFAEWVNENIKPILEKEINEKFSNL
jgi:predicted transcriptional regulator